jgi:hypothetical protein
MPSGRGSLRGIVLRRYETARLNRALYYLLLLLALGMSLVGVLVGGLRVLLRSISLLFTVGVVALAVMFRRRTVRLSRVLVVLSGFVMFVSRHFPPRWLFAPSRHQIAYLSLVPRPFTSRERPLPTPHTSRGG